MKNISSLKGNKTQSPKTPGGISKSLLTPCRRIGLSRNWKKAGPSPFVSPLSGSTTADNANSVETKLEKKESRKRKTRNTDEELEEVQKPTIVNGDGKNDDDGDGHAPSADIVGTPSRHVELPRKKKSKMLLSAITEEDDADNGHISSPNEVQGDENAITNKENNVFDTEKVEKVEEAVIIPVRKKSNSKSKKINPINSNPKQLRKEPLLTPTTIQKESNTDQQTVVKHDNPIKNTADLNKSRSPNELTKKCIVVIQKKIFKTDKINTGKAEAENSRKTEENNVLSKENKKLPSQTLFDSDSDDLPLNQLNKEKNEPVDTQIITIDDDDDFSDTKKVKVKKLEDKNTCTGGLKSLSTKKKLNMKNKVTTQKVVEQKPTSQSSIDDDDFDFDNKKTILIRKTYDKITKPMKAKSTGSITQKDIDDLKARIEVKKKLLLAKAMTEDTKELRDLIKKWQKGCQDALMELMQLMKTKFPDKQNMAYSEMLQSLKIPADLVGYDSDNDCFGTPDDASIILSKFKD